MDKHLVWLWLWYFIGTFTYWMKRAYYLVTGPNPVASTYRQFWQRCWIPLLVRAFLDAMVYWIFFIPGIGTRVLAYLGWTSYEWAVNLITQFAPFSALFGHAIDSILDFAISKIPWIKDILPQMPAPLPATPAQIQTKTIAKAEYEK